jgi:amidase
MHAMMMLSATEAAREIRQGKLSPVELLDACLANVDKLNPVLNAVVWRNDEEARAEAKTWERNVTKARSRGELDSLPPFAGVPIPIKDLTNVAGQVTTFGSYGAPDQPAKEDAKIVSAFRKAGFILCGRTNTPELGPIPAAENLRFGITRNPWNPDLTPGGSSGGAAASVASGMFPVAHGNDGGGSIRIPASCCGLVGLKPARGRVPETVVELLGLAYQGVETRTVEDTGAILDCTSEFDPYGWPCAPAPERPFAEEVGKDPGQLRIAVITKTVTDIEVGPNQLEAVRQAAELLESMGHRVEEVEPPSSAMEMVGPFLEVFFGGVGFDWLPEGFDFSKMDAHLRLAYEQAGKPYQIVEVMRAFSTLQRVSRKLIAEMESMADLFLMPTMACDPPQAGSILEQLHADPGGLPLEVFAMASFTPLANATGQPALSLPTFWSPQGVPVGVMLTGTPYSEAMLLRVAAKLEEAVGWTKRWPEMASDQGVAD